MPIRVNLGGAQLKERLQGLRHSRRARRWAIGIVTALAVYGLLGFFAVPALVRGPAQQQLGALLGRPVSIARIRFNPYTLRAEADQVRIGEPAGSPADAPPFVDLGRLVVRVSWFSLLRLHPIVRHVLLDTPQINLVRKAEQEFNFTDLVEKFSKPSVASKPSKPLLYAVHNIQVKDGRIAFDDRVLNQRHLLDGLQIGIPFIANLPSKVDTFVQPLLQVRVDGTPLALTAQAKPFAASLDSDVKLHLDPLDLPQLQGYAPETLPVRLTQGKFAADLDLHFAKTGDQPTVQILGSVDLSGLALTDRAGAPLLAAATIHVKADGLEPLRQVYHLAELRIDQPVVNLARDKSGAINLLKLAAAAPQKPEAKPETPAKEEAPLDFSLQSLALNDGIIHVRDAAAAAPVSLDLQKLSLNAGGISTLGKPPASFTLRTELAQGGSIDLKGGLSLAGHQVNAEVNLDKVVLPTFQPYVAGALAVSIAKGTTDAHLKLKADWKAPGLGLRLEDSDSEIDGLALDAGGGHLATQEHAAIKLRLLDLAERRVEVSSFEVRGLVLNGVRGADGQFNLVSIVKPQPQAKTASAAQAQPQSPWTYQVDHIAVNGVFNMTDASTPRPVKLSLPGLDVQVQDLSGEPGKPLKLDLKSGFQKQGTLAASGTVELQPALKAALHLEAHKLDVAAVAPYFEDQLNAIIASAQAGLKGDLKFSNEGGKWKAHFAGDTGLGSVRMLDRVTSDPFAGWQKLAVTHIEAGYGGSKGTHVHVGKISLDGFHARIILSSDGHMNLQDFLRKNGENKSLTRAESQAAPAAPAPDSAPASASNPAPPPEPAATPAPAAAPPLSLAFDQTVLSNGQVDYTDNFIKPNFSARLVGMQGSVGAIGTGTTTPAPVNLTANLDGNGPLTLSGSVNPLAQPLFLDLSANSRDIELSNFSAYSVKYTGYPIIKGKLNVDLRYHVDQGQLSADNHIFIDQFTFGDHVDSPSAVNLPVRLAVSLLKNSRGEIDLNLPVSGSLSDPQFDIGGIVWHAVLNMVEKAVTSPFALLGAAFGGSAELGYVEFKPGEALISDTESAKLDKLNKALADRPAVKLDLVGHADPALDTPGLKQEMVERMVKREKLKDIAGKGQSIDVDSVAVAPEEHDKYLARAYDDAKVKKPRNFIGVAKSVPPDQEKQILLDSIQVGDPELTALAQARAIAVQKWFDGKVDSSRIFMVAPKLTSEEMKDKGPTTRVEFVIK